MDGCCLRIHQDRRIGHEMHCRTRMQRDTISMLIGMRFLAGRRRRSQEATFDLEGVNEDIDPSPCSRIVLQLGRHLRL